MCHLLPVTFHLSCVTCHVSHVMCHMSCVTYHVSHVMCNMSLTPTATAMDPPHGNSPTVQSRMVPEDQQIYFLRKVF